jgi:hypothetical protein
LNYIYFIIQLCYNWCNDSNFNSFLNYIVYFIYHYLELFVSRLYYNIRNITFSNILKMSMLRVASEIQSNFIFEFSLFIIFPEFSFWASCCIATFRQFWSFRFLTDLIVLRNIRFVLPLNFQNTSANQKISTSSYTWLVFKFLLSFN